MLLFHTAIKQSVLERLQSVKSVCIVFITYLPNMTPFKSLSKYKSVYCFSFHGTVNSLGFSMRNILFAARNNNERQKKNISKTVSINMLLSWLLVGAYSEQKNRFEQTNENKNRIGFMELLKRFPWNWAVCLSFFSCSSNVDVYSVSNSCRFICAANKIQYT